MIRTTDRDELRRFLDERRIGTAIHYPLPVHRQPAYRERGLSAGTLARTEKLCDEILSLPMFPQLTDADVDRVIAIDPRMDHKSNPDARPLDVSLAEPSISTQAADAEACEHFVTLFDASFLPIGLSLYRSLEAHARPFRLWVLAVDDEVERHLARLALPHLSVIPLRSHRDAALLAVKPGRTRAEYCWTMTPFACQAVFEQDPSGQPRHVRRRRCLLLR